MLKVTTAHYNKILKLASAIKVFTQIGKKDMRSFYLLSFDQGLTIEVRKDEHWKQNSGARLNCVIFVKIEILQHIITIFSKIHTT